MFGVVLCEHKYIVPTLRVGVSLNQGFQSGNRVACPSQSKLFLRFRSVHSDVVQVYNQPLLVDGSCFDKYEYEDVDGSCFDKYIAFSSCGEYLPKHLHQHLVLFLAITTPLFPTHRFAFKKHDLSSWSLFEWWISGMPITIYKAILSFRSVRSDVACTQPQLEMIIMCRSS